MATATHKEIFQGIMARNRGAMDRATEYFREALSSDPENGLAHAQLAITLAMSRRPLGALEEAKRALRYAPDDASSHIAMAMAAVMVDDPVRARAAIDEALRLDPASTDALQMRCALAVRERDMPALQTAAQALRGAAPDDVTAPVFLSEVAWSKGDAARAEDEARAALAIAPDVAAAHAAIGRAFLLQKRFDDARDAGLSALSIDPTSRGAQGLLTDVRLGRLPLVGPVFRVVVRLNDMSISRMMKLCAPPFIALMIGLEVLRHYQIQWGRDVLNLGLIGLGVTVWAVMMIHGREMAKFRKQAKLKTDY